MIHNYRLIGPVAQFNFAVCMPSFDRPDGTYCVEIIKENITILLLLQYSRQ